MHIPDIDVPRGRVIAVEGLKMHYLDWGSPKMPTVVLLHGLGSNCHTWDHIACGLRRSFHVVAPDQRGHGDTPWTAEGYATRQFVGDLAGFADGLRMDRFSLVGHSMGGMNAIGYAARHPGRVERLVIVDIGPEIPEAVRHRRSQPMPAWFGSVQDVFAYMRSEDPLPADDLLMHRARFAVKQTLSGEWTWKADPALGHPALGFRPLSPDDMWHLLEAVPCPTLIVRGERSNLLAREVAERMQRVIPRCALVEIPDAGHRVPLDNPEGFEAAVREFLES